MTKFMAGPPGGRTLPLAIPRLSDMDGGVYGPGASVASTGINAARPVIKTANARAAGETWEDLLEYYLVSTVFLFPNLELKARIISSMPIVAKWISPIVWAGYFTRAVSTLVWVVSPQEVMVPAVFPGISTVLDITSSGLLDKSGHRIHQTLATTANICPEKICQKPRVILLSLLVTLVECICVVRV